MGRVCFSRVLCLLRPRSVIPTVPNHALQQTGTDSKAFCYWRRLTLPTAVAELGIVMRCYDITRSLHNTLAAWPGDTPFNFRLTGQLGQGAVVNVGAVSMGLHNGTHADAPFHYVADGASIDALPLDLFIGPAVVADVSHAGWIIEQSHLAHVEADFANAPRLLLKTGRWPDSTRFPEKIPTLAPGVPAWLAAAGVRLVGLDVPSVDTIDSKTLPVHHALAAANIYIIESLDLSEVPAGTYELIALPLKIVGGDASPIRALLREKLV